MVGYFKLNADGSIQSANKQHEGFESFDLLAKDTDGSLYDFYLTTPDIDGIYQADTVKIDSTSLALAKAAKLAQIDSDYILADETPVVVNHTAHGDIAYYGGSESAKAIRDYIDGNKLEAVTIHNIWDINGTETPLNDAEAEAVLIALNSKARIDKFAKKDRKVALAIATTLTEVEVI